MKGLLMKEMSAKSVFSREYILFRLKSQGAPPVPPIAREDVSVRFLVVANFQGATLQAVNASQRLGKPHVAVSVDFRSGDVAQFKNAYTQFVLRFTDVRNFIMPKFDGAVYILGVEVVQNGDRLAVQWELNYFIDGRPYFHTLTIDCGGVEISAM